MIPATIVGSANGRSITELTIDFPRKSSRTRTQAIRVPAKALTTTTPSDRSSVSLSALIARGFVISSQKMPGPSAPDWMTTAANGIRTSTDR